MSIEDIKESVKGIAFHVKRIIMKPGTYPKAWRSNVTIPHSNVPDIRKCSQSIILILIILERNLRFTNMSD